MVMQALKPDQLQKITEEIRDFEQVTSSGDTFFFTKYWKAQKTLCGIAMERKNLAESTFEDRLFQEDELETEADEVLLSMTID